MYAFQCLCNYVDVMPSIEDAMVLLNVPILEYILYPHLRQSMELKVKPIHKVIIYFFFIMCRNLDLLCH